jgi:capsid portal protein
LKIRETNSSFNLNKHRPSWKNSFRQAKLTRPKRKWMKCKNCLKQIFKQLNIGVNYLRCRMSSWGKIILINNTCLFNLVRVCRRRSLEVSLISESICLARRLHRNKRFAMSIREQNPQLSSRSPVPPSWVSNKCQMTRCSL